MNGFNIERFGLLNSGQETIEKEVIKEVIKYVEVPVVEEKEVVKIEYIEVPVDKIVEVVKYVDVPVEIIKEVIVIQEVEKEVIKEVPVEKVVTKIEYISDNTQTNELLLKIQQLETEMSKRDENLDELRHNLDIALDKPPVEIEKIVEVIKEVNVEVPVEVIKEFIKEVRVEVPVEVIIEKENNESSLKPKFDALQNTVQKLRQEILDKDKLIKEYQSTIEDIQKYQGETKAVYLKGSNLDNKLYK
jgi:hypothetical protein